jgi:hypothetical protein
MADLQSQLEGVRTILQQVEDTLLEEGWDDITLATRYGTFSWVTSARVKEIGAETERADSP